MQGFREALRETLARWPGDFSLAFVSRHGDVDRGTAEVLRIRGDGAAEFLSSSLPAGSAGPVGTFAGSLEVARVKAVAEAFAGIDLDTLPRRAVPGSDPLLVEVTAGGQVQVFAQDDLFAVPSVSQVVRSFQFDAIQTLTASPRAALSLQLAQDGARWSLTFHKLGKEPLLIGNPLAEGPSKARVTLVVAVGEDAAGDVIWEEFAVPVAEPFSGAGPWLALDRDVVVSFEDPSGGKLAKALAVRAIFGGGDAPPSRRLGGIDVITGPVPSNAVVPK